MRASEEVVLAESIIVVTKFKPRDNVRVHPHLL